MTSLRGTVVVSSPGAPPVLLSSPGDGEVLVSPGVQGPPGHGVNLAGAVPTYADLPELTAIPALDTSQVTNMQSMFFYCSSLATIPALDTSQVADIRFMFDYCSSLESVTLPGMGNGFTTGSVDAYRTLDMRVTKLNTVAANTLMHSLGTPPPGGNLQLPATATGADTSITTAKNWTVTIG